MVRYEAEVLIRKPARLGEGPVWDTAQRALYYVDIEGGVVHRYVPETGILICQNMGDMVGCVAPVGRGGMIAAVRDHLVRIGPDLRLAEEIFRIPLEGVLRFNDGKCDAWGRLWVGVMAADQSAPGAARGGSLYCLESGKAPVKALEGLTIPNGMAWTADNKAFYHIDTASACVRRYGYDGESGKIGEGRSVIEIPPEDGVPDGMCIDAEGMLWIALWGGRKVARCDPDSGKRLAEVTVPAKYVSCCTFGGQSMNELFITTAMDEEGNGGEVYSVCTGVRGTRPFSFRL